MSNYTKTKIGSVVVKSKILSEKRGVKRILVCCGELSTVAVLVDNTYNNQRLTSNMSRALFQEYGAVWVNYGGSSGKSRLKKMGITGKRTRKIAMQEPFLNEIFEKGAANKLSQEEIFKILDHKTVGRYIYAIISNEVVDIYLHSFQRKFLIQCLVDDTCYAVDAYRMAEDMGLPTVFNCSPKEAHRRMMIEHKKQNLKGKERIALPANEWIIDALTPVWDGVVKTPRTALEIHQWGIDQDHCVGSYEYDVLEGEREVFGLFDKDGNHIYTGDWIPSSEKLVQLNKKHNVFAEKELFERIEEALTKEKSQCD